jgi:two-component system nitrogen regulation sensor histidine kinase NtrY
LEFGENEIKSVVSITKNLYYRYTLLAISGLAIILLCYFIYQKNSPEILAKRATAKLQNEITQIEKQVLQELSDSNTLFQVFENTSQKEAYLNSLYKEPFEILMYKDGELAFWSSNAIIPTNINRLFKTEFTFVKLNNGFYEVIRKDYANGFTVIGMIPLYFNYPINNQFLAEGFNFKPPLLMNLKIASTPTNNTIKSYDGEVLFSTIIDQSKEIRCPPFLWWIQFLGILLLISSGIRLSANYFKQDDDWKGGFVLLLTLLIGAFIHYSPFLLYVHHTPLFSSKIYASSSFISSLGILLVFSILAFLIALFVNRFLILPKISISNTILGDVFAFLMYVFIGVIFVVTSLIIKSVVDNSTISFDFYNFYTLSIYSLIGLIIFALWFVVLYISCRKLIAGTMSISIIKILAIAGISIVLVFFIFQTLNLQGFSAFWLTLFYALIVAYFIFSERDLLKLNFINYLLIISIFAGTTAHIITSHNESNQFNKQKAYISELLFERDFSEEFELLEVTSELAEDNFVKRNFSFPYLSDFSVEELILNKYFTEFQSRYNIKIYLFNANQLPLKGELDLDYNTLLSLYNDRSQNIVSPNIKYFSSTKQSLKYLVHYPFYLEDEIKSISGYLFVSIIPKVFGSSSAYPELLISRSQQSKPVEDDFEYAIYENGSLIKSKGEYEYTAELYFPAGGKGEYLFYNDDNYDHLVYNSDDEITVVLSKTKRSFISPFSAFSYTFCFYLLIMLLLWVLGLKFFLVDKSKLEQEDQPVTLQRRIQISMISLVLSSLLIIGFITLFYFQNQYDYYHNDRLLRKASTFTKSLEAYIQDENVDTLSVEKFETIMRKRLPTIAAVNALDLNVYYPNGNLMLSSQPDIFNRSLVSEKLDPQGMLHLAEMGKSRHVQNERIGNLNYLAAYIPWKNRNDEIVAYLHFPYYSKQQSYRDDISYFLVALVNVYVLLIIAATGIALVLSRSITNSLTVIKERLSTIKLKEKNVPIVWKNNDEIGMLVQEYNRMIFELDKSAELLAKSERESAWREMAKQVAHEIKNPLTPMKLSIQHLQRALKEDRGDIKELTEKVSVRLIEQIDSLTQIASEFSNFAKMPIAELTKIDLKEVIQSTTDLFQNLQHVDIITELPDHPCSINADKNQMIGVFNNLLKNATQAINEDSKGIIKVLLIDKEDVFRVEIEDNGVGIPEEKRNNVFEPNFTTKSSGTGLGLAISKSIIEKSGGNIWFDSTVDVGTTFYIVLPKYETSIIDNKNKNEEK